MKPHWIFYLAVGLTTAGWVSLTSWIGRDTNCYMDNCTPQAVLSWIGLSAILIVSTAASTRRMGRVSLRSLIGLAATFTLSGMLALASWLYALDPADTSEAWLVAVFGPFFGIPVVLGAALVVALLVQRFWPRHSDADSVP
jgi:hypothetical protein